MRGKGAGGGRQGREHQAIAQLMHTLKEINLNQSWKGQSAKLHKTRPNQQATNLMTEHEIELLFAKSKDLSREPRDPSQDLRLEPNRREPARQQPPRQDRNKTRTEVGEGRYCSGGRRDFASTRFLRLDQDYDRLLSGLPAPAGADKENFCAGEEGDLTAKFKRDYVIGKVIGEGAYASVRVAVYRPENRKIAIKAYEKAKIREAVRKRTIRREIRILQSISHCNIVKIYDVVESNNHLNIIMEYLPGTVLSTALKQQPQHKFPENHCRTVIRQLANALAYLHRKHIAHRDIKLENVILSEGLQAKVIDFGFSTCIEPHTKVKIFCGTPSYMAPEIVQKEEYRGEPADIWALGVMVFVMLCGYFPFKGASDEELYRRIKAADYPVHDITHFRRAHHLLARMFALDPAQRISAQQVLNHPWLTDEPLEEPPPARPSLLDLRKGLPSRDKSLLSRERVLVSREKTLDSRDKALGSRDKALGSREKALGSREKTLGSKELTHSREPREWVLRDADQRERAAFSKTQKGPGVRGERGARQKSPSGAQRIKIMDFLRLELKRCSESLSPVKSHRL